MTDRRMFTLFELFMVVLGVGFLLLVFVGMFMPFPKNRSREKARRVNCAGNLKQIGLGILMYSGDNGGYFPNTNDNYGVPGNLNWYPVGSLDYCTSIGKLWSCPSSDVTRSYETWSSYRYIGSGLMDDNATATMVSLGYDLSGNHPHNAWVNALFIDGHVEGAKPGTKPELWGND